jgi:hypothetical protein
VEFDLIADLLQGLADPAIVTEGDRPKAPPRHRGVSCLDHRTAGRTGKLQRFIQIVATDMDEVRSY